MVPDRVQLVLQPANAPVPGLPGVDVNSVGKELSELTTKAADISAPVAKEALTAYSAAESLAASDPSTFISATGAAAALVLLSPTLIPLLIAAARGYTGDLPPTKALDLLSASDATLVDLRSPSQIEARGVPSLPKNSTNKLARRTQRRPSATQLCPADQCAGWPANPAGCTCARVRGAPVRRFAWSSTR